MKIFFLNSLGLNEPNNLSKLDEFYALRNDIMHRNGKTKQGTPININEKILSQ